MDGVNAVGQHFRLREAVFVAHKVVALGVVSSVIAAGEFQENVKFRTSLRGFKLSVAVVGVLDEGDITLFDGFIHRISDSGVFHLIILSFCADVMGGFV